MPLLPPALTARLTGYLLLFSGMAVVGTYVALTKPLAAVFPVFLLAWLRFGIAAVVMLPWTMPRRRRSWQGATQSPAALSRWREPAERRLLRGLFLQSFFGNFLFSICMLTGVSLTTASAAGVILATLPAVVAMFSWVFLREHLSARVWGAVALAVSGVALLTLARTDAAGSGSVAGNLLVFACVCCEAVYVILGKRLTASLSPIRISALINLIGLALMTPLGLWQALSFDFGQVAATDWAVLGFYALAASIFSTWLWLSGLKHVPANHSGVFTIAMPMATCAVAVIWLGEQMGPAHLVAFGLAAAGIGLIAWPSRSGRER